MREKGQSLFEVVVALAISAVIIIALVSLVSNSVRNAVFSRNSTQAALMAQEAIEWLRGERDNDTAAFLVNVQIPTYCLMNLNWNQSGSCGTNDFIAGTSFIREVAFSLSTISGKTLVQADVTISWRDTQGIHEVKNSTNFTDWRQR